MIFLMQKVIDPDTMPVLYDKPFSPDTLAADFDIRGGEWRVEEGWLTGKNPLNTPGMMISRSDYFGDVMLDFSARTVFPSTHDINIMWNGSWVEETNSRGIAYVIGIQGWWHGKLGFEKSPAYTLNVGTPLFSFVPGQVYHVQAGSVRGHIFVVIDGKLALEITDPDPIDNQKYGRIGFEAYCSHIQFKDFKLRRAVWEPHGDSYTPEF
jgi:hypothetical protein